MVGHSFFSKVWQSSFALPHYYFVLYVVAHHLARSQVLQFDVLILPNIFAGSQQAIANLLGSGGKSQISALSKSEVWKNFF